MILTMDDLRLIQECLMRSTDAVDGDGDADAYILEQKINKFLRGVFIELKSIHGGNSND